MLAQLTSAFVRAVLVAMLIATPSLCLPVVAIDTSQITIIVALLAGLLVFFEYNGRYPSILEFRFAAPYNRLKFFMLAVTVLCLSLMARGMSTPSLVSDFITEHARIVASYADFPFSPIRSVLGLLPEGTNPVQVDMVRTVAGLAYAMSLTMVVLFFLLVKLFGWPIRSGAFNVCLNLPLFDPTGGGDVVDRLKGDATLNLCLGFVLPFLLPLAIYGVTDIVGRFGFLDPQTMIWMTCAWAFMPASLVMRGIALLRIAQLINLKRERAYAQTDGEEREAYQAI